ncbi:hypothetical protein LN650_31040 [Klebsiella pneumoniae subsp. pneumoniae]|nr:hypothetical protein [Klebsiella pneumoniae subsp. pneumoniae]
MTARCGAYNLWVLEVRRIWLDSSWRELRLLHHQGRWPFRVSTERQLDLSDRMVKWRDLMD